MKSAALCFALMFFSSLLAGSPWFTAPEVITGEPGKGTVQGIVFHDLNGDGKHQPNEPGIAGVLVSNGLEVVKTDADGRYEIPSRSDMDLTVVQPSGWRVPTNEALVPQFFHVVKEEGSPVPLRFGGLAPTGPAPSIVNFPLQPLTLESDSFTAAALTDTQAYSNAELSYLRDGIYHSLLNGERGRPHLLLITGDVVGDDLTLLDRLLGLGAALRIPQYLVFGNHDLDFDAPDEASSTDSWRNLYGPPYYAFSVQNVLFIILNNVRYPIDEGGARPVYNGAVSENQMTWLRNLIALTPPEKQIVLAHHIPFVSFVDATSTRHQTDQAPEIYELLEGRPVLSLSGHTHTTENHSPGQIFAGWTEAVGVGPLPFRHLILGAGSGAWFQGDFNAFGVPMALQRMGAPPGYFLLEFSESSYVETYVGAGYGNRDFWTGFNTPAYRDWFESIMDWNRSSPRSRDPLPPLSIKDLPDTRILTPEELAEDTFLTVNVWGGSAETQVRAVINDTLELELSRTQSGTGEEAQVGALWSDPFATQRQLSVARFAFQSRSGIERNQGFEAFRGSSFGPAAPQPQRSIADRNMHLWKVRLPNDLPLGIHRLEVVSVDRHGRESRELILFEVRSERPNPRWQEQFWE
jgi:hypothetical protein